MTIKVITSNAGKYKEFEMYLSAFFMRTTQVPLDLEEIQSLDLTEIVRHKAQQCIALGYTNCLIEDTALYFEGMGKLPGAFIKWFLQELGIIRLHELAQAIGSGRASAHTLIAYVDESKVIHCFAGTTDGKIVPPQGSAFGWSPIFMPDGSDMTYGELSVEAKQQYGQRSKALRSFITFMGK